MTKINMRIDLHIHRDPSPTTIQKLDRIIWLLEKLRTEGTTLMAKIDDLIQSVNDESTLEDSLITLLSSVQQQLKDILSGATLPPDVQSKLDAAFANLEANKAKLAAALTANTPAAPPA